MMHYLPFIRKFESLHIAFSSPQNGVWQINVVDSDGSNLHLLTDTDDAFPAWSPDGRHIAFIAVRDKQPRLYMMDTDGSDQQRLADVIVQTTVPVWSPDSQQVAFTSAYEEVYRVKVDDLALYRVAEYAESPTWSPDAKQLAFAAYRKFGRWSIYVEDIENSHEHELTPNLPDDNRFPAWSPDGQYIAFLSDVWENVKLYKINADGSNLSLLATDVVFGNRPAWSPNGTNIAFLALCNEQVEIYVADLQGKGRCLTTSGVSQISPVWSP